MRKVYFLLGISVVVGMVASCGGGQFSENNSSSDDLVNEDVAALDGVASNPVVSRPYWFDEVAKMTTGSGLIVAGHVKDIRSEKLSVDWLDRDVIVSNNLIEISDVLKGDVGSTVIVSQLGGCFDRECLTVSHQAQFEEGEEVLLFLVRNGDGWSPYMSDQGKICLDGRYLRPDKQFDKVKKDDLIKIVRSVLAERL